MSSAAFVGSMAEFMREFVEYKRAMGWPYEHSARSLRQFAALSFDVCPKATTVTKTACDAWIKARPEEHPNGLTRRLTPIRQFAKYLIGLGIDAYVIPAGIGNKRMPYRAHIYTDEELALFFASVDSCEKSPYSPLRYLVIPVFFRVLYCCGLRSSEARLLHVEDVDLESGRVEIRESKGWRGRIVYMSDALKTICQDYDAALNTMLPNRVPFFPNAKGMFYGRSTVDAWFHEFWDHLPAAANVVGNAARVHDMRHSWAVKKIDSWVREGRDLNALYPYLSEYMGHRNYADTDYYLQLTASFYPELERKMTPINTLILPEVTYGDAQ